MGQKVRQENIETKNAEGSQRIGADLEASIVVAKINRFFHVLARALAGLHWAIGITTLQPEATPAQERAFVLWWFGIVLGIVLWCVFLLFLFH